MNIGGLVLEKRIWLKTLDTSAYILSVKNTLLFTLMLFILLYECYKFGTFFE